LSGKLVEIKSKAKGMERIAASPDNSCYCRFHTLRCTHSHAEREENEATSARYITPDVAPPLTCHYIKNRKLQKPKKDSPKQIKKLKLTFDGKRATLRKPKKDSLKQIKKLIFDG
jgi:hypothetical protein